MERGIIIGIDWLVWCIKKNLEGKSIIGKNCGEEKRCVEKGYIQLLYFFKR